MLFSGSPFTAIIFFIIGIEYNYILEISNITRGTDINEVPQIKGLFFGIHLYLPKYFSTEANIFVQFLI